MNDFAASPAEHDEPLYEVLSAYLDSVAEGCAPPLPELVKRHPQFASDLQRFFDNRRHFTELTEPLIAVTLRAHETVRFENADSNAATPSGAHTAAASADFKPRDFGDYELVAQIASGGMGVVYKARQKSLNRIVALKRIRSAQLADDLEVQRFRSEAESAAQLDHPSIVPIYEIGAVDGEQFFSMKLIEGSSLDRQLVRVARDQRMAASLLIKVARAVQYAHERGIIHRDLKPANILLDRHDEPHITDFGLAKRMDIDSGLTQSGAIVGTPSYMAPEQASAKKDLTPAVDVYALGAILYELLTLRAPFRAANPLDTVLQVVHRDPVRPRLLNSRADRDLETICLKCLEKQPARRYTSAEALAGELERWLRGEPIHARPANAIERVVKWARRNPAVAALTIIAPMFCMLLVLGGLVRLASYRFARAEQPLRIKSALETDSFAARHVASTILLQLELLGKDVQRLSDDPELIRSLSRNDSAALQRLMDKARGAQATTTDTPFASWYILNARGDILALAPHNRDIVGKSFRGRDYFQGPLRATRGNAVYISRVFLAENDNLYKFGISVLVRGRAAADAPPLGVLVATVTTDTTVGQANLQDPRRKAVLVGPLDSNPAHQDPGDDANPATYVILLHPSYHRGDEAVAFPHDKWRFIKQPEVRQAGDDDYADPVATQDSAYAGRWLAGFAPVGDTEFMVIIQERFDEAIERTVISFGELALWAVAGGALLIMLLGGGAWVLWGRFSRQPQTGPLGAAQK